MPIPCLKTQSLLICCHLLPHCACSACSPGDGEFSIEQDRHVVGTMMRNLIETQMRSSLILGDLASYRFSVTFSQSSHVQAASSCQPWRGVVSEIGPL